MNSFHRPRTFCCEFLFGPPLRKIRLTHSTSLGQHLSVFGKSSQTMFQYDADFCMRSQCLFSRRDTFFTLRRMSFFCRYKLTPFLYHMC
jgi:hypothetical protein